MVWCCRRRRCLLTFKCFHDNLSSSYSIDFKLGSVVSYYKRMDGIDFGGPPFFCLEIRGQKRGQKCYFFVGFHNNVSFNNLIAL